jgi:hypothetical protein
VTDELKALLRKELQLLEDAAAVLSYSYEKCSRISRKDEYLPEELESFESLCSRFARLSDIIIQKVFRLLDELALESPGSVRDRINRAEKREIIDSAEVFVAIRMLRNDIAHEYLPDAMMDIFAKALELSPHLLKCVESIKAYSDRVV